MWLKSGGLQITWWMTFLCIIIHNDHRYSETRLSPKMKNDADNGRMLENEIHSRSPGTTTLTHRGRIKTENSPKFESQKACARRRRLCKRSTRLWGWKSSWRTYEIGCFIRQILIFDPFRVARNWKRKERERKKGESKAAQKSTPSSRLSENSLFLCVCVYIPIHID